MNVAICCSGEIYGGVEQCVLTLACNLNHIQGLNVIVVLFNKGMLYHKLIENNINVVTFVKRHKYDMRFIADCKRIFKVYNIDLVHIHGYKAGILAGLAAKICKIKVIKTEHGLIEPMDSIGYSKMLVNLFCDKIVSRHSVDAAVFVSQDIARQANRGYPFSRKYVIYNGIDAIKRGKEKEVRVNKKCFNIGIIGRITEIKGHVYLFEAIKKLSHLKNIVVYIFGDGPLKEFCEKFVKENKLTEIIQFMGFKADIHDYMKKLDTLIMCSLHEGLPYTVLEAMYLGIPIIASNVGGLKEIIQNNVDGILVPPKSTSLLAVAIESLYWSEKRRASLSESAYKKVIKDFSSAEMVRRYVQVYNTTLGYRGVVSRGDHDIVRSRVSV